MNTRKGFTLIELLVVISIIAVLMGILMPSLQKVRDQARGVICQSHLRELGVIWSMYLDENRGKFPAFRNQDNDTWLEMYKDFSGEVDELMYCPITSKNMRMYEGASVRKAVITTSENGGEPIGSYALNEWVLNDRNAGGGRDDQDYWRSNQQKGLNNIPVMGDAAWRMDGQPNHTDTPPDYEGQPRAGINNGEIRVFAIPRHSRGINMLFMDWSVRHVGIKGLWRLKWSKGFDTHYPLPKWPEWMAGFSETDL